MIANKAPAALGLVLLLAACQQQQPAAENRTVLAENAATAPPGTTAPAPTPAPRPDPANETAAPEPTAPPLTQAAERSETGARAVLLDFARAIELKRFGQAYDLLSPADKQRWSRSDFAAIFKGLGKITVAVPTGRMKGAAGSSYYTAPITVTSADQDGRPIRIEGEAVLRRVNDVPGASPEQLRWRIDKVTLDWTH